MQPFQGLERGGASRREEGQVGTLIWHQAGGLLTLLTWTLVSGLAPSSHRASRGPMSLEQMGSIPTQEGS